MKSNNLKSLFLVMFLFFAASLYAQDTTQEKFYKTKNHTFRVKEGGIGKNVVEKHNIITGKKALNPEDLFKVDPQKLAGKEDVYSSFIKVLGPSVIDNIPKDLVIMVNMFINRQGKIIRVAYFGVEKTGLTMDDFDRLTTYIKENVSYSVPSDIGHAKYGSLYYKLKFSELKNLKGN